MDVRVVDLSTGQETLRSYTQEELDAIANTPPTEPPSILEQIRALERQYADDQAKLTRQSLLVLALDKACALPQAAGMTRDQVHAYLMSQDKGYKALFNLEAQVALLRAQI